MNDLAYYHQHLPKVTRGVVKHHPGELHRIIAINSGEQNRWFQVFNLKRLPNNGDVPLLSLLVPAGASWEWNVPAILPWEDDQPWPCPAGIAWAASKTSGFLTGGRPAAQFMVHIWYR